MWTWQSYPSSDELYHGFFSNTARKAHKYIKKIGDRYFYTQQQLDGYMNKGRKAAGKAISSAVDRIKYKAAVAKTNYETRGARHKIKHNRTGLGLTHARVLSNAKAKQADYDRRHKKKTPERIYIKNNGLVGPDNHPKINHKRTVSKSSGGPTSIRGGSLFTPGPHSKITVDNTPKRNSEFGNYKRVTGESLYGSKKKRRKKK